MRVEFALVEDVGIPVVRHEQRGILPTAPSRRPGDLNVYFANSGQKWVFFGKGNLPVDEGGSHTELVDDDGSAEFADLHQRATESPVLSSG